MVFITDIIPIIINQVVVHKNLGRRASVTVGAFDGHAARVIWRPKGVVVNDILVDGNIISRKHHACARTIRYSVVAYYDMMNSAAGADAVSICGIVLVWCRLRLTGRDALSVPEDGEAVDNDIGGTPGRVPYLDPIPGGAVL